MTKKKEAEAEVTAPIINAIFVDVYPEFSGKTIESRKYSGLLNEHKDKNRFDCRIAIPATDEEAKKLYNLDLAKLIEMGVRQHTYSEAGTKELMEDALKSKVDMGSEKFVAKMAESLKTSFMFTERISRVGEAKKAQNELAELYRAHGLDPLKNTQADLIKAIQAGR